MTHELEKFNGCFPFFSKGGKAHSPRQLSNLTTGSRGLHHIVFKRVNQAIIFVLLIVAIEASLNDQREERLVGHFFSSGLNN
jgi:hypothetical protein